MLGPEQTQGSCPRRHSAPCSRSLTWVRTPNAAWLTFPSLSSLAVPELLSHRAVPHRLHTLARQARGFELAPLIAGRARERRMFPTLQWFMFPAPLSPKFPISPHPAHVPSARLAHVPVATSHDIRVDALLPPAVQRAPPPLQRRPQPSLRRVDCDQMRDIAVGNITLGYLVPHARDVPHVSSAVSSLCAFDVTCSMQTVSSSSSRTSPALVPARRARQRVRGCLGQRGRGRSEPDP